MFVDLDGPLNASSLLSASAELLVTFIFAISMKFGVPLHNLVPRTVTY